MRAKTIVLLTIVVTGLLRADTVIYTVIPSAGAFVYQFTVENTGATGGSLFDLFLSLQTPITNIDTMNIGVPVGWGDSSGGLLFFGPNVNPSNSFVEWSADASGLYDIGTGASLGGFSFSVSDPSVGPISFALNESIILAVAQQVSAVPEPSSFMLDVLGLVALFCTARLRRGRLSLRSSWSKSKRGPDHGRKNVHLRSASNKPSSTERIPRVRYPLLVAVSAPKTQVIPINDSSNEKNTPPFQTYPAIPP